MIGDNSKKPVRILFDEAGYYLGNHDDGLKRTLRDIEGVPNATYIVKDGRVFVFNKLVELVKERCSSITDQSLSAQARTLVPEATVSAKEAVVTWGIVPEPYEMVRQDDNALKIRDGAFNAWLPGTFQTQEEVLDAFASLLTGGILSGEGDFTYRGQPMLLCDPLDTSLLPPHPIMEHIEDPNGWFYSALENVEHESGFPPITKTLFDDVKARATEWKKSISQASRHAQDHASDIWRRAAILKLETLDDPAEEAPEYGKEYLAELRSLYPELSMLSDGSLYEWFDLYQMDCCFSNGWTANRDDGFLFYLLGSVADINYKEDRAMKAGEWVAYALLRGDSLHQAISFAKSASLYDFAISKLARRIADAMRFLAADNKINMVRHGPEVTTMVDVFTMGRKHNVSTITVGQGVDY